MDQGTPHKTRDSVTNRGESGEKLRRYEHRGKIPGTRINAGLSYHLAATSLYFKIFLNTWPGVTVVLWACGDDPWDSAALAKLMTTRAAIGQVEKQSE